MVASFYKGWTINDREGGPERIEKKNSMALLQGKEFQEAFLEKKIQKASPRKKKLQRPSRGKKM